MVRRLILMRHAKAERHWAASDDKSREINTRGRTEAAATASQIAPFVEARAIALVSPALRTVQTADVIEETIEIGERIIVDALYMASPGAIEDAVKTHAAADTIIVIGHNPGMHDCAYDFAMRGHNGQDGMLARLSGGFPTSYAALFEVDADGADPLARLTLSDFLGRGAR